jgi:hypothetical protein
MGAIATETIARPANDFFDRFAELDWAFIVAPVALKSVQTEGPEWEC